MTRLKINVEAESDVAVITLAMRLTILPVVWALALTVGRRQSRKHENEAGRAD